MDFNFSFTTENTTPNYIVKMFGEAKKHRWDSGVTNGSDWHEKKWYEGILIIQERLTKKENHLFFKTYEVCDEQLFPFTIGHILTVPIDYVSGGSALNQTINNFCEKVLNSSIQKENWPFPFIEIPQHFMNTSGYDAQIEAFANYGQERD
ncbi:MAG: hypothetical protein WCQ32_02775 [bacterium]